MNFQAYLDPIRSGAGFDPEEHRSCAAGTDELIDALFAGSRAGWRPFFDRLAGQVCAFGDVSLCPARTYVGFNRAGRKFAIVQPAEGHFDVGLKCPGLPPAGRFRSAQGWNAMVTHRIRLLSDDDDDELVEWLRDAHEAAAESAPGEARWSCD